jgi:N-acetylneuraminic acid mutarotase
MIQKRNGASAVIIDQAIFIFGGYNTWLNSLDTIERYSIEFDKWSNVSVRLKIPIHDSIAFNLGGARVLICGGLSKNIPNKRFDIYDLTCECISEEEISVEVGFHAIPSFYDPVQGELYNFFGYGD